MRRRSRDDRGAAAVEFALLLFPLLLPILGGVVDMGTAIVLQAQMQEAAQEAASYGAQNPTKLAEAERRAKDAVTMATLDPARIDVTCSAGTVTAAVEHTHETIILKVVIPDDLTIRTTMKAGVLAPSC